jgi:hypothetical protein
MWDFAGFQKDIENNAHPQYISGDFNTTTSMGSMNGLLRRYQDSFRVARSLVPRTWGIAPLLLWRIDYNLLSPGLVPLSHETIWRQEESDHALLKVVFGW